MLYPEWFAYKWQDTNNSGYMNHIDGEWKRHYEHDPIVDRPAVELTTLELKNWARNKIITGKLTKKQYYNMAIIIRQSLEYLVELGELPSNHFAELKINSSLFTPVIPKEGEQEVFTEAEEKKLKELSAAEFGEHPNRTAALVVLINFSLGLRVGELVALKWKDLKDSYLHIRRMEQKQYEQLENGKWKKHLEVVEHTKSDAGYRTLYVVSSAMELFDKVKEANLRNGYTCEAEDYIFMYCKHRITANSIDSHFERYCKQIGISKKDNHKASLRVPDIPAYYDIHLHHGVYDKYLRFLTEFSRAWHSNPPSDVFGSCNKHLDRYQSAAEANASQIHYDVVR